ncbi:hypothetical protein KSC_026980 [Ktedonobacter sp. SOSP1-52]|nr:hypothetical protein [Ktedonobacter sp. SOSP1-52]GHO63806.1 hypothetical protein KSC_026980 [Ktedonobacter sp. SOSP1-52]
MRQMSGCRKTPLAKQRQHLCCRNVRHPKHEVMPTHERFGLIQNSDRAGHIALGESQAGEQYPTGSNGVDVYLPRELGTLLPLLQSFLQVDTSGLRTRTVEISVVIH